MISRRFLLVWGTVLLGLVPFFETTAAAQLAPGLSTAVLVAPAMVSIEQDSGVSASAHLEITAPREGEVLRAGEPIHLTAIAVDPAGYIARVEFYDFEKLVGVSNFAFFRAPDPGTPITHEVVWANPTVGEHSFTARASDSKGALIISPAVHCRLPIVPLVSIITLDPEATEYPSIMSYADWARFSIFRAGDLAQDLYVVFSLHGTAQPNKDYQNLDHYVRIPAGESDAVVQIEPLSDEEAEPMETVALRLEDPMPISALPVAPTPYTIPANRGQAAAVIYDRTPPNTPQLQIAVPDDGEVILDTRGIGVSAAAYHPTFDVTHAELYIDDVFAVSSDVNFVRLKPGGLVMHDFMDQYPLPGPHILTVRAKLPDGTVLFSNKVRVTVRSLGPVVTNQPPVITFLHPVSGAVFTAGDPVDIAAVAKDPDGSVLKFVLLVDGQVVANTPSSEIHFTWPAVTGTHTLSARATDDDGADTISLPVQIVVREVEAMSFVQRLLPAGYVPGQAFDVQLKATPPADTSAYAVEDGPPQGWVVSQISHDGVYDGATARVKFGVFTDDQSRTLSYRLTPPVMASGTHDFLGTSSRNGKLFPIAGNTRITPAEQQHPADRDPADFALNMQELTAYASAWKQGQSWSTGPNPIPLSYVTRAAQLWKHGEKYFYAPQLGSPPACWQSANPWLLGLASVPSSAEAVRQVSGLSGGDSTVLVQIKVTPGLDVSAYAVEERLPWGWKVQSVSDGGTLDPGTQCLRWGLFMDAQPRSLSYEARVAWSGLDCLRGHLSCDGNDQPIVDEVAFAWTGTSGPVFRHVECPSGGKVRLELAGPPEQVWALESSSDLEHWSELTWFFLPGGQLIYEDPAETAVGQRFYRTRSP